MFGDDPKEFAQSSKVPHSRYPSFSHATSSTFGDSADFELCRRLHQRHGKTYYFATQRFPAEMRRRVHALYGFVRVPDEWVDNPGEAGREERLRLLDDYRRQLLRGFEGVRPSNAIVRAFCDVLNQTGIPIDEPLLFLDSMKMDVSVQRYATYGDLRRYMRGSASSVGVMMCHILTPDTNELMLSAAKALGEAMQLTNFIRDVAEDAARGRIYIPLEDLQSFAVSEQDILDGRMSPDFIALIKFEIERARTLYRLADRGIAALPSEARKAVKLARILYSRILNHVEAQQYNVFRTRAKTSRLEKLATAAAVWLKP